MTSFSTIQYLKNLKIETNKLWFLRKTSSWDQTYGNISKSFNKFLFKQTFNCKLFSTIPKAFVYLNLNSEILITGLTIKLLFDWFSLKKRNSSSIAYWLTARMFPYSFISTHTVKKNKLRQSNLILISQSDWMRLEYFRDGADCFS